MKTILAFGNPLLDITVTSKNCVALLLKEHNLQIDGQKEVSCMEMQSMSEKIKGLKCHITAGGCSQNSLRVLQWILKRQCNVFIFGSVGRDREADLLKECLTNEGVQTAYIMQENLPTGKTIALISDLNRSLVAHIGAAEVLSLSSLKSYPNFENIFNSSHILLIEAFFLTNRSETIEYLLEMCHKHNKIVAFNLCGEYIFHVVPHAVEDTVKRSTLIFGNRAEFTALACLLKYCSIDEMAKFFTEQNKTMIVTNGADEVICYGSEIVKITPSRIESNQIKDTTAAGDAFIAGYLAGLVMSKTVRDCIRLGCYASSCIIKENGCSLPQYEANIDFL
ncbi:hypothetical protein ABEB36_006398 [Hypothenemus hampei]|uniref:Adenosine kinase n=1 Tax=Hypothenemus hampei TaxID=57062 RepID=A0ABD1EQU9_HYPHA